MYQYENGIKKKNVGFVRVEAKGGQCKLTLHIQLLGQLDSIFPTYLIQRGAEGIELIYLGDTILKNQIMDSKLIANENNIMGSGFDLEQMGGLLLFLNDNVFVATDWDSKPIVAEEVMEALRPKKNSSSSNTQGNNPYIFRATSMVQDVPERTLEEELNTPRYKLPGGFKMIERLQYQGAIPSNEAYGTVHDLELRIKDGNDKVEANSITVERDEIGYTGNNYNNRENNTVVESDDLYNVKVESDDLYNVKVESDAIGVMDEGANIRSNLREESLETINNSEAEHPMANKFFEHYPRIYPFEDKEIILCVKIEPRDIGAFSKDLWPYSNNSFLMHGYYCYHHLIFAKMKTVTGYQYILGIPGIYHNKEQLMARMFGFDKFKSIRKRELRQGDFGYWYIPIAL